MTAPLLTLRPYQSFSIETLRNARRPRSSDFRGLLTINHRTGALTVTSAGLSCPLPPAQLWSAPLTGIHHGYALIDRKRHHHASHGADDRGAASATAAGPLPR